MALSLSSSLGAKDSGALPVPKVWLSSAMRGADGYHGAVHGRRRHQGTLSKHRAAPRRTDHGITSFTSNSNSNSNRNCSSNGTITITTTTVIVTTSVTATVN